MNMELAVAQVKCMEIQIILLEASLESLKKRVHNMQEAIMNEEDRAWEKIMNSASGVVV